MLVSHLIRTLVADPRHHPRGCTHLSSASGLVRVQGRLYVVADDEHHLAMLLETGPNDAPVELLRLFKGNLPKDKRKRKAAKPDLETLLVLPPLSGCPHGALLALGSGSRPTRETGVLIALNARGEAMQRMTAIDLSGFYAPLRDNFDDLNIEGAFIASGELRLLQRANKGNARNACLSFDWNHMAPWLVGRRAEPPAVKGIQSIELGELNDVPLGLTDGAALQGGAWAFCAVAENTGNSFQDGACAGSAVGVIGPDGALLQLHELYGAPKVEGIAVQAEGNEMVMTLVTDADDPALASQLLQARTQRIAPAR